MKAPAVCVTGCEIVSVASGSVTRTVAARPPSTAMAIGRSSVAEGPVYLIMPLPSGKASVPMPKASTVSAVKSPVPVQASVESAPAVMQAAPNRQTIALRSVSVVMSSSLSSLQFHMAAV